MAGLSNSQAAIVEPDPLHSNDAQVLQYRNTTVHYQAIGRQQIEAQVHLNADHPHFAGHFPGFPILPAVSQVDYVCRLIEATTGQRTLVKNLKRCKFTAMLRPSTVVNVKVEHANGQAKWEMSCGEQIVSRGQLEYACEN